MSEDTLKSYKEELQDMNAHAKQMVIFLAVLIHLFLNAYAQVYGTPMLKMLVPTLTVITAVAMVISGKYFEEH